MCPVCNEPLVVFELGGVEIDRCVECGGTWLDAGELAHLVEFSGAADTAESGKLTQAVQEAPFGAKTKRRCPRCRTKLRVITLAGNVEVDRCPKGDGLWLDKGEVEAIIQSFRDESGDLPEEGTVARFFSELFRNELKSKGE